MPTSAMTDVVFDLLEALLRIVRVSRQGSHLHFLNHKIFTFKAKFC